MAQSGLRPGEDLSATDVEIIRELQTDGRRPIADLGRSLSIPPKTLARRINELREAGVIDLTAVSTPEALGYTRGALLGIRLGPQVGTAEVAAALWSYDFVDYLSVVSGPFDLIVEIFGRDDADLLRIIDDHIRNLEGVGGLEIFPYLSLHYQRFGFVPRDITGERAETLGVHGATLEFDDTDQRIVASLNLDGRRPFQDIGDELGVSESQVRRRVGRMVDSGGLRLMAMANPISLGYEALGWLAITAAPGASVKALADVLTRVSSVIYIVIAAGRYDLFVDVVARDRADLLDVLDSEIRPRPEVHFAELWLHLQLQWRPLRPRLGP